MSSPSAPQPSRAAIERAIAATTLNLHPVRRLPSDAVLTGFALLAFVAVSLAAAFAMGTRGFQQLSTFQCLLYYTTLLACGTLLSVGLAPQIVPGARRRIGVAALAIPVLATAVCAAIIFPQADLNRFVPRGIPCLRAGLECAAASGALAFFLLRREYLATPLQTSVFSAVLAGFTGVSMLALHCPQQNWIHVWVWHLGAPVIAALAVWIVWQIQSVVEAA